MKTAVALLFVAGAAVAQPVQRARPVVCDETEKILQHFQENLGEKPVWTGAGDDDKSIYMIVQHPETSEWTIIHFNNRVACILGAGTRSRSVSPSRKLM